MADTDVGFFSMVKVYRSSEFSRRDAGKVEVDGAWEWDYPFCLFIYGYPAN